MPINPYTSQSITGYNSSPPPDDGSQTQANKVEWAKHKEKIGDPLKALAEAINSQCSSAFNAVALEDWSVRTTTATIAESDWHSGILMTASGRVNYPAPSTLENGWHNYIYNGATTSVPLQATATDFFRTASGALASEFIVDVGKLVKVYNTATQYLVQGGEQQNLVYLGMQYSFSNTCVTGTDLITATMVMTATLGTEHITANFTPNQVGDILQVEGQFFGAPFNNTSLSVIITNSTATTATPIATHIQSFSGSDHFRGQSLRTWVTSTATTTYTFRLRAGANTGSHAMNGTSAGASNLSPHMSFIQVTELDA